MSSVFADLLRAFDRGGEPSEELLGDAWLALQRVLVRQLEVRGLWLAPPAYLGVLGRASWSDPAALEELLVDCWEFVFIDRLRGLRVRLEAGTAIDGLITRNVGNFLFELQKRHDPLGYRLYILLQTAVQQVIDEGGLRILSGPPKPASASVVGPPAALPFLARESSAKPIAARFLEPMVARWCDDLLPDLVTADRGARLRLLARLGDCLVKLPQAGVEAFRLGDLAAVLKQTVRSRWSVVWDLSEGETAIEGSESATAELVRLVRPDQDLEERDAFTRLGLDIEQAIDRLEVGEPSCGYLQELWLFLRLWSSGGELAACPRDRWGEIPEQLPSQRHLALLLGIPRGRLPSLFETLGGLVQQWNAANSPPRSVTEKQSSLVGRERAGRSG